MAEKVTSMRLNEEDLEQFKEFAKENGLSQQQAFNSLIALAELEKAKDNAEKIAEIQKKSADRELKLTLVKNKLGIS